MKTKYNNAALFLLISITMLSACQGAKAAANLENTEAQNQVNSDNQDETGETATVQKTYSDPDDIKLMLEELKQVRTEQWLAQPGWWQEQKVLKSQSGNLHGAGGEWWFQFSDSQSCPQTLQIIYQEDGQVLETSVLISESRLPTESSNSRASDEENEVLLVKVPDQSCPALFEMTLDQIEVILDDSTLESAEAVILDGYLTITLHQKNDTYGPVLTVTIDLITGFITNEKNQLYIRDNSEPEGEVEYSYLYQYYDQLPQEIQNKFNQAFAKLQ
ncbi:MAG: hypothetical protein AB2L18_02840 [Anaerolineaceae bacterium]